MNLKTIAFLCAVALVAFAGTLAGHLVGSRLQVLPEEVVAQMGNPLELGLQPFAGDERLQPAPDLSAEIASSTQDEKDGDQSAALASAIDLEMPDATPEEKQVWREELQSLTPETAREILNLRNRLASNGANSDQPAAAIFSDAVVVPSTRD